MTLPDILQVGSPLRPWAFALGFCLVASLPKFSRRLAGILAVAVVGVASVWFFLDAVFRDFTPMK